MENVTGLVEEEWIDLCEEGSLLDRSTVRYPLIVIYLFVFSVCLLGENFLR